VITRRPTLVRAEGIHVWDRDGRRYLDATSGAFCVQLGYSRPDLVRAMAEAAGRLPHARPSLFDSEESAEYSRALLAVVRPPYTRVVLTSSGSEAVDVALKAAHLYQRAVGGVGRGVRYLTGHYHGATLGALGVTGWGARREAYDDLVGPSDAGPPAYCKRCFLDLTYPSCGLSCADAPYKVRTLTVRKLEGAPSNVEPGPRASLPAAIILETIPAAGLGAPVPPPGYFARIRARCDETGALWIADEVLTGFARVGSMFAWQRLAERTAADGARPDAGATPDIVVFGKGAGAGYAALAGVILTERVAAALDRAGFRHVQTYGGNPIACAVGRRVLEALREEAIYDRVRKLEGAFESTLRRALEGIPGVTDIRGMGLLWGVELEVAEAVAIAERCRERGVLVHAAHGDGTEAILLAPPLIADVAVFEEIADAIRAAVPATARR
jgi:adenosylmethionine-8-amino-7-oxononanoate aminotransferase